MALPYQNQSAGKKQQVAQMFDNIAARYDFLNHFLSLGIDKLWRRRAVKILSKHNPKRILDVATGTGDFAIAQVKLKPEAIIGADISRKMLDAGIVKIEKKKLSQLISMEMGDAENLRFETGHFNAVTSAFGVRNFENLEKGIAEMHRVLAPGGIICILEFSQPERFPVKQLYNAYFRWILPLIGRMVSKDHSAYTYLPESVKEFPYNQAFLDVLSRAGFTEVRQRKLSFGISSIYYGIKK